MKCSRYMCMRLSNVTCSCRLTYTSAGYRRWIGVPRTGTVCNIGNRILSGTYFTSHVSRMASKVGSSSKNDKNFTLNAWEDTATLYVHWPYCSKRCTYCNFNKYINNNVDHRRMERCLEKEIQSLTKVSGVKKIGSIFFGGGTPSLAQPQTLQRVVETAAACALLPGDAEVSLEANPTLLETKKIREMKQAGVNRLSVGTQSFSHKFLKLLGREHSGEDAVRCIEEAKSVFPGKTSLDLIFGLPEQSISEWESDLKQAINVADNHISLYQLTLERGTALFKDIMMGHYVMPDDDVVAEMYELAVQVLEDAGFERYEVSNFARKNARSTHNQAYWRGDNYIGVGPGAHGRFLVHTKEGRHREARIQTLEPQPWMTEVEKYGDGTRKRVIQETNDILEEILMLGLRTKEGISNVHWQKFSNSSIQDIFACNEDVQDFVDLGLLRLDEESLCATSKGLNVIDSVLRVLLNSLHHNLQDQDSKHT
ncbi:radical S-adenosyl methionine domain-containing protein 1, mitochondrial [Lingula anatina]|uniref:Radical S-adenosyl methionine domain-containing protein 1, mitochondrial n=1 Tax=Lingula anatina TaxID=7574 RepID=A0A1S3HL60_LINAN|nr:radical S-adenosyl methionine domain-containing protein 1, mitochondrial [Lingula anatina]|eukprot:XP_013386845.1 radical S-adenosyl methionine domain-containing protein 1, mitochondrial [Lingula anatina]